MIATEMKIAFPESIGARMLSNKDTVNRLIRSNFFDSKTKLAN